MPRALLRCQSCSTTDEVDLTSTEEERVRTGGFLGRYCNRCHAQGRWVLQQTAAPSFRKEWASSSTAAAEKQHSILIIDDDESILRILERALSREGYDLQLASSARRAVELLGRSDFDLILSDVHMPEFDGKQLFAFLDQNMREYRSKIVFLTGDTDSIDMLRFFKESGAALIFKPLDLPALLQMVKERLKPQK